MIKIKSLKSVKMDEPQIGFTQPLHSPYADFAGL